MKSLTALLCAFTLSAPAFAGVGNAKDTKTIEEPCPPNSLLLINTSADYVGESKFRHGGGKQDAMHFDFEVDQRIPLGFAWPNHECGKWYLRIGADYDRFDFDTEHQSRVPNTLQSATAVIALEYVVHDDAAIMLETRPGVYFEHDINGGAFDAVTTLAFAYPVFGGDKFYAIFGVAGAALWSPHFLPVIGATWYISDKWELDAVLPDPRLIYKASDKLQIWAGGELAGGAYKTDRRDVDPHKLSGAVVTYTDIRAGGGVTWKAKPFTVELAAGASMQREFDYARAGSRFRTRPAPYVELAIETRF
jgi:hypothetical protein